MIRPIDCVPQTPRPTPSSRVLTPTLFSPNSVLDPPTTSVVSALCRGYRFSWHGRPLMCRCVDVRADLRTAIEGGGIKSETSPKPQFAYLPSSERADSSVDRRTMVRSHTACSISVVALSASAHGPPLRRKVQKRAKRDPKTAAVCLSAVVHTF